MTSQEIDGAKIVSDVLAGLKGFQRKTVDHVFRRMYDDLNPAMRFLVADEVGLGKTLVARGLIAKTIQRLQEQRRQAHRRHLHLLQRRHRPTEHPAPQRHGPERLLAGVTNHPAAAAAPSPQ